MTDNSINEATAMVLAQQTTQKTVWLTWHVENQSGNSRYELERSTDGITFNTIAIVFPDLEENNQHEEVSTMRLHEVLYITIISTFDPVTGYDQQPTIYAYSTPVPSVLLLFRTSICTKPVYRQSL